MKAKLEEALRTVQQAQQEIAEAKPTYANGATAGFEEVEMGLEWVRKRLEKLARRAEAVEQ